jgi:hypothetical protein
VPQHDGDGGSTDTDEELVAQIIPLRQRERGSAPQTVIERPGPRSGRGEDALPPLERSVWDQPTTELRRRAPAAADSGVPGLAARAWRRGLPRPVKFGAAAAGGVVCVVLLMFAVGALQGPSASLPRRARLSAPGAISASNRPPAGAKRASARPGSSSAGRRTYHPKQNARPRRHHRVAPTRAMPSATPAAALAVADAGAAPQAGDSAAAPSQTPPAYGAPAPTQNQCVPGELGC